MLTKTVPFWWDEDPDDYAYDAGNYHPTLASIHARLHAMKHPPVVRHGHITNDATPANAGTWTRSKRWYKTF